MLALQVDLTAIQTKQQLPYACLQSTFPLLFCRLHALHKMKESNHKEQVTCRYVQVNQVACSLTVRATDYYWGYRSPTTA